MTAVELYHWNTIKKEQLNPLLMRQVIYGEKLTVSRLELGKGCVVPEHAHENEQMSVLLTGRLRFHLSGREVMLEAGSVLHIPSNAPHDVLALEDSTVMDVFAPPRDDWRTGDDAYLRR
jgi:quercetin dioxygenase-like cupin family protein